MVAPIYIVAIALGVAFSLGFFGKRSAGFASGLFYAALAAIGFISAQWLTGFLFNQQTTTEVFTAGFKAPFTISLQMGLTEAVITSMINLAGLFGAIFFADQLKKYGANLMISFLLLIMGLNVIVMTRDIFNLFVFLEIASIAMAGMALVTREEKSVQAGFKYLIATAIISALLLVGIILTYNYGESLYINDLLAANLTGIKAGATAIFLILMPVILELKPFPANGWGLDMYQATHPVVGSLLSAASATASLFVLYKLAPLGGETGMQVIAVLGGLTFVASNLMGLKQSHAGRMLGYSSIAQTGLVMMVIGLQAVLGEYTLLIGFSILLTHFLAKAGLFWLRGILKTDKLKSWGKLRNTPLLLFVFVLFIVALTGFPPFPSFFGKWELVMQLANSGHAWWIAFLLPGSLLEAVYLFRWLGYSLKIKSEDRIKQKVHQLIPVYTFAALLLTTVYFYLNHFYPDSMLQYLPLAFVALMFVLEFLPARLKNILAIAGMGAYTWLLTDQYLGEDNLRFFFALIFLVGGILTMIPGFREKGKRVGFYPAAVMMYAGLGMLITATDLLQFFIAWEIMTLGSYLLIIRGKRSIKHAFSYMLFSLGGAFAMLAGFGFAQAGNPGIGLDVLANMSYLPGLTAVLLAIGFMTKTAALGLHIWLPGAHAEAESDVSPMVSAILLKAGVFGLLLLFIGMGAEAAGGHPLVIALGWLGALSAFVGNLAASFQEDAKKLLAYSSIGQLGYILFAFSMMTHLGWLAGLTYVAGHASYKAILFLGIGAVVIRTGTHNMYQMGGLIKKMPLTFIGVLFAIITLAGIPPLVGFAGKWLFYNAVIMKGWYLQGTIVFTAGIIAFLYSFRILYSVFLGHLKDQHRKVKEAPVSYLIPMFILMAGIMLFSFKPELILQPLGNMISGFFPSNTLDWDGGTALTSLGYWNGWQVGVIIMIMFAIITGWLLLTSRKAKKVGQFNIVYAAERPERPETTHMAYNMFAGYNKAVGFLAAPGITNIWRGIDAFFHDLGDSLRKIYSGNAQSYLIHILAYTVIVFMIINFGI
ncbi:MAG: proton-conducting transporter membrane subunit [Bacteroidales bacterium]